MDSAKRNEKVKTWFAKNFRLLAQERLHRADFGEMIERSRGRFFFRNGFLETLDAIEKYKIPMYIVSGGIYNVIEESLKMVVPNYAQLKIKGLINIVSNRLEFDGTTHYSSGFRGPMVYTFNKAKVLSDLYKDKFSSADNVIVLGDHFSVYFIFNYFRTQK